MTDDATEVLASRARQGDRKAFDRLVADARAPALAAIRRLVGHPDDCDDVFQDASLRAWRGIDNFAGRSAFATWFTSIAARAAIDFLRSQKRWRPEAQVAYANLCAESETLSGEVLAHFAAPDFAFEAHEHISYCFTCVGRSLVPDELAVLVLRDILGFSAREAANALGISDSVLRHRLAAARTAMQERFEGLCSLVNKQGICYQCSGLRSLAPADRRGSPVPDLADFERRCDIVRNSASQSMQKLHAVFWRRTKDIEEAGSGSTRPESGCGQED